MSGKSFKKHCGSVVWQTNSVKNVVILCCQIFHALFAKQYNIEWIFKYFHLWNSFRLLPATVKLIPHENCLCFALIYDFFSFVFFFCPKTASTAVCNYVSSAFFQKKKNVIYELTIDATWTNNFAVFLTNLTQYVWFQRNKRNK